MKDVILVKSKDLAEQLLNRVSAVDKNVKRVFSDKTLRYKLLGTLEMSFKGFEDNYSDLADDVILLIEEYHTNKSELKGVIDFVYILELYNMYFNDKDNPSDYWDRDGKYYKLRMNEIINLFLIGKHQ